MGDFDGDGFLDLFFTGSVSNGKKPEAGPCGVLYRNRGDGTFEDVTARSGIRSCGWTMGASWVDLDGSGRLDLVVTGVGRTRLWKNLGDGTFREEGAARGLVAPGYSVGPRGRRRQRGRARRPLRRRLSRHRRTRGRRSFRQLAGAASPEDYAGQQATLLVQDADGPFPRAREGRRRDERGRPRASRRSSSTTTATAATTSTSRTTGRRTSSTAGSGDGTFEDVTVETGRRRARPEGCRGREWGSPWATSTATAGRTILVTNFAGEPMTLYRNVEGALFDDATEASGVERRSFPYVQWGTDIVGPRRRRPPRPRRRPGHLVPRILLTIARLFGKGGLGMYGSATALQAAAVVYRNAGGGRLADATRRRATWRPAPVRPRSRGGRRRRRRARGRRPRRGVRRHPPHEEHDAVARPRARDPARRGGGITAPSSARRSSSRRAASGRCRSSSSGRPTPRARGCRCTSASARRPRPTVEVVPPGRTVPAARFDAVAADRLYTLRDGKLEEKRGFLGR